MVRFVLLKLFSITVKVDQDEFCWFCNKKAAVDNKVNTLFSKTNEENNFHVNICPQFEDLKQLDSKSMGNAIDLNEISQKIDNQRYDSFFEFIVDIRNIHHHCSTCASDLYK